MTQGSNFSIFKDMGRRTRSVHLDWFGNDEPKIVADGFRRVADAGLEKAGTDAQHPDSAFWPIAFLYRHSIEIYLKEVIRMGSLLLDEQASPTDLRGHRLARLWGVALRVLNGVWPNGAESELEPIRQVVVDFDNVDPNGDAFRYRFDLQGRAHLQNMPQVISLQLMAEHCNEAIEMLDGVLTGIATCLQQKREFQSYERSDFDWGYF